MAGFNMKISFDVDSATAEMCLNIVNFYCKANGVRICQNSNAGAYEFYKPRKEITWVKDN